MSCDKKPLRMVWLELTRFCNEKCGHCYNDSGVHHKSDAVLAPRRWLEIIAEIGTRGCERLQFIGGEPTLVRELPTYIAAANAAGIHRIEVFTNGTAITDELVACFQRYGVRVAMSVYSDSALDHDLVTGLPGSHSRLVDGVRRLVAAKVPVRFGVIVKGGDAAEKLGRVRSFATTLGVTDVGADRIRNFGRAAAKTGATPAASELCGRCTSGSICVHPDGNVTPCIMSVAWPVGNLLTGGVAQLLGSDRFAAVRDELNSEFRSRQGASQGEDGQLVLAGGCDPDGGCGPSCMPGSGPCYPVSGSNCQPVGSSYCSPHQCMPGNGACYPKS